MRVFIFIFVLLQSLWLRGQTASLTNVTGSCSIKTAESEGKLINGGKTLLFTSHTTSKSEATTKQAANGEEHVVLKNTFVISVPQSGNYYFKAGVLSTYVRDKQFQEISVFVNGVYQGLLDCNADGLIVATVKEKPCLRLNKGENVVEFTSACPFYPEISAVYVSEYSQGLATSLEDFTPTPSSRVTASNFKWQTHPKEKVLDTVSMITAWQDVPVTFTYHRKITVSSAGKITLSTAPIDGEDYYAVDPYMYFYNIDNPSKYSWSNDNSIGLHPKLEMNVPAGDYYLVICSKRNAYAGSSVPQEGLVKVYYNGSILTEQAVVGGYMINAPIQYKTVLNYFTSKTSASVRLFLIDDKKMMFNTEPYTYYPPADYSWYYGARRKIQTNQTRPNWKVLVTSTGAITALWGSCDVYCGLKDAPSKYLSKFPNLKSGDAILLGEDDSKYNSAAWAGGITNKKIWIGNSSYGYPYGWTSWDNYFANTPMRYSGAKSYSRTARGELSIVMYSKDSTMTGVSHFAVTNHANDKLHGFAYDSKIGTWGRITHEYNSLNGTEYGKPYALYYASTPVTTKTSIGAVEDDNPTLYTLQNSINDGLTVEREVVLETGEENAMQQLLARNETKMLTVKKLFDDWTKVVNTGGELQENIITLLNNEQGKALVTYSKQHLQEAVSLFGSLLFDMNVNTELSSDKELLSILFCKIAADKYADVLEKIKEDWMENPYTEDGSYIYPSCEYFTKQYIKKIMQYEFKTVGDNVDVMEAGLSNDNHLFCLTDNPVSDNGTDIMLHVPKGKVFSVRVVEAVTGKQSNVVNGMIAEQESYVFHLNAQDIPEGLNVCVLEIDGKTYSRKLTKK